MNTKNLLRKLPSCLLGAIFAAGIASTTMVNAVDGDPDPGLFELEGNTTDDAGAGTDWDPLYTESLKLLTDPPGTPVYPDNLITFTTILADPSPQTIYWKGPTKDINDLNEWWYKDGSVPDKDDITNAYAAAFSNPTRVCVDNLTDNNVVACNNDASDVIAHKEGDLIVYFGLDRFANDGDAFAGFWFFQNDVSTNASSQFDGVHKARDADGPGDMLILVEYPQASGAVPVIKIYEWVDSGGDVSTHLDLLKTVSNAECNDIDGKAQVACAITNLDELTEAPAWPYTPKSGNIDNIPFESFFEGGVNVTQLLGSTPCFSSFLAETRASRSETSILKDFVLGNFDVCGATVTKSCESDINDDGDKVTVTFSGDAKNIGGLPLYVTLMDDQANAVITAVCINDTDGECGSGEDGLPADLAGLDTDTASFSLAAGQTARYEGEYEVTAFDETTVFSDTVTLKFYQDDMVTFIDETSATSEECPPTGDPSIDAFKACTAKVINDGTEVERTVSGYVTNDGNVKLIDVYLDDNTLDESQFTLALDGGDGVPGGDDVAFAGELVIGATLWFEYTFTNTSLSHSNTITAYGTNVFDVSEEVNDSAPVLSCAPELVRGLKITKDCDTSNSTSGVRLVVENNQLVIEVDNIIEVENIGDPNQPLVPGEALNVTVSDDQVDTLVQVSGPTFTCVGNSCSGELKFGEIVKFEQEYRPNASLGDLSDPDSVIFKNTATAEGTGVLTNEELEDVTDFAECPLCS